MIHPNQATKRKKKTNNAMPSVFHPTWLPVGIILLLGLGSASGLAQAIPESTPTNPFYENVPVTENTPVSTQELKKWIEKLRSPRAADRNAAEQAILNMGVDILPLLPSSATLTHPSQRQAIDRIRQHLSAIIATASTPSGSITLHGNLPVSTILEEVSTQSHNNVVDDPLAKDDPSCEVTFDSATFWEVIEAIAAQANRQICVTREGNTIELRQMGTCVQTETGVSPENLQNIPFSSISGAYRVTLDKIQLQQYWSPTPKSQMLLFFSFFREPRVRVLRVALDPNSIQIKTDSDPKEKGVQNNTNVPMIQRSVADESITTSFQVPLPTPPRSASQIELLIGKFLVAYSDEPVILDIADCLNSNVQDKKAAQEDVQLSIKNIRRESSSSVTAILEIVWGHSETMPDSFEIQSVPFAWELVSHSGETILPESVQVTQSGPYAMQIEVGFRLPEANPLTPSPQAAPTVYRLHGSIPKGFRLIEVPFEYHHIPLP